MPVDLSYLCRDYCFAETYNGTVRFPVVRNYLVICIVPEVPVCCNVIMFSEAEIVAELPLYQQSGIR